MKNIFLKNPFLFGMIFLIIGLLGYQELKSFIFGLIFLLVALCLFVVAFFKKS
jgi:protein-S-isoprenylcysteine O-methyltransferase Ste14|tara:strand:- start:2316 stop:2474 length:159 start_codon:yes stop_codon:yes gene_type:complete